MSASTINASAISGLLGLETRRFVVCNHQIAASDRKGYWFCDRCNKDSKKNKDQRGPGKRYRCLEGCNYDLCTECYESHLQELAERERQRQEQQEREKQKLVELAKQRQEQQNETDQREAALAKIEQERKEQLKEEKKAAKEERRRSVVELQERKEAEERERRETEELEKRAKLAAEEKEAAGHGDVERLTDSSAESAQAGSSWCCCRASSVELAVEAVVEPTVADGVVPGEAEPPALAEQPPPAPLAASAPPPPEDVPASLAAKVARTKGVRMHHGAVQHDAVAAGVGMHHAAVQQAEKGAHGQVETARGQEANGGFSSWWCCAPQHEDVTDSLLIGVERSPGAVMDVGHALAE